MRKSINRRLECLEKIKAREDNKPKVIEIVLVEPGEKPGGQRVVSTLTMNLKTGEKTWHPPMDDDGENGQ